MQTPLYWYKNEYNKTGGVSITNTDTPPIIFKSLFSGSFFAYFFLEKSRSFFAYAFCFSAHIIGRDFDGIKRADSFLHKLVKRQLVLLNEHFFKLGLGLGMLGCEHRTAVLVGLNYDQGIQNEAIRGYGE